MWAKARLLRRSGLFAIVVLSSTLTGEDLSAEQIRIGLSVPNQSFYTPLFAAANDLGYFKQANLDVKITEYRGGSAAQEGLSAGAADLITYFPGGMALAVSKGVKQKIVGSVTPGAAAWYMFVQPNSSIRTPADLNGKKVGITTKGSTTDLFSLWSAERAGVTIQSIALGGGGLIPALRTNQVDAIVAFSPLSLQLLTTGAGRAIVDYNKEMPPMLLDAWVASQDMIDRRPEQIRAFFREFYRAVEYLQNNRTQALEWLKQHTLVDDPKVLELAYKETTMLQSLDGAFEDKWIADSLEMSGKTWGMPELLKMTPAQLSTHEFTPVKR
jgi:NitT/TauT family transport system substrate-binding protein